MAIYKRYRVEQKYVDGIPQEEYRLGEIYDDTPYHSLETCEAGHECILDYRWFEIEDEYICEGEAQYAKEKYQQKCRNDEEWVDVYPQEFRKGRLIAEQGVQCGARVLNVHTSTDGKGSITILNERSYFSLGEDVIIDAAPYDSFAHNFYQYRYGSTSEYGSDWFESRLILSSISTDMWVSAVFNAKEGLLRYTYTDGTVSEYPYSSTYLTGSQFGGSSAVKIEDLNGTVGELAMFYSAPNLKEVDFPNVYKLYNYCFSGVTTLETVNLPNLRAIPNGCFASTWALSSVSFPLVSEVGYRAFVCGGVSYAYLPECQIVASSAFDGTMLSYIDLPKCVSVGQLAFYYTRLSYASLPECTYIGPAAFRSTSQMTSLYAPKLETVHNWIIEGTNITTLSFPNLIQFYGKLDCPTLSSIYLHGSSMASNYGWNHSQIFSNCHPNLSIYIPESLCAEYHNYYSTYYAVMNDNTTRYLSEMFVCGEGSKYYNITTSVLGGEGSITVEPSRESYFNGTYAYVTIAPTDGYSIVSYSITPSLSVPYNSSYMRFSLPMNNNWDITASFEFKYSGSCYFSTWMADGTVSYYTTSTESFALNCPTPFGIIGISDECGLLTSFKSGGVPTESGLSYVKAMGLTTIHDYTFYNLTNLKTVIIPSCTRIGKSAFTNVPIESITLNNVSYIDNLAFENCSLLSEVYLSTSSVVRFYNIEDAFVRCHPNLSIYLPDSLCGDYHSRYGEDTVYLYGGTRRSFADIFVCSLPKPPVPPVPETFSLKIGYSGNEPSYVTWNKSTFSKADLANSKITYIEDVGGGITTLGVGTFSYCYYLSYASFPMAEVVGDGCFGICSTLTEVNVENAKYLGDRAFNYCPLSSITLNNIQSLSSIVFFSCPSLKVVDMRNISSVPTILGSYIFYLCPKLENIYIPSSLFSGFMSDNKWKQYSKDFMQF